MPHWKEQVAWNLYGWIPRNLKEKSTQSANLAKPQDKIVFVLFHPR
jgi:hypothetical protein